MNSQICLNDLTCVKFADFFDSVDVLFLFVTSLAEDHVFAFQTFEVKPDA